MAGVLDERKAYGAGALRNAVVNAAHQSEAVIADLKAENAGRHDSLSVPNPYNASN